MAELPLYNKDGKSSGNVEVDEKLFGDKVLKRLLHQVVVIYEANRRQGNAHTKDRSEVSYSTKKPWPQKHTGMARAGSRRSPLWRHGGTIFGPRKHSFRKNMTVSMRRAALNSAILGKIQDKEVGVLEGLEFENPKTGKLAKILKTTGIKGKALIAVKGDNNAVWLSVRNIEGVSMKRVNDLNAYEILKHKNLLLTQDALNTLVDARKGKKAKPAKKSS